MHHLNGQPPRCHNGTQLAVSARQRGQADPTCWPQAVSPRELTSAGLSDASAGWHPNKGGREGQGQSPKPVPRPTVDAGAETALKLRIGAYYVGSGTGRHQQLRPVLTPLLFLVTT